MSNRPRHPLPLFLKDLAYNPKSGKYEVSENGISYSMDLEQTRLLKEYFSGFYPGCNRSISDWFNKLGKETKKRVYRDGPINSITDFYPDPEYSE